MTCIPVPACLPTRLLIEYSKVMTPPYPTTRYGAADTGL